MSTALWIALLLAGPTQPAQPAQPAPLDARALTRRSILEYDTGNYAKALADVEQAYELDPRPALLFNLAQCHRALGHYREAALAFKSYLREVPNAKNARRPPTRAPRCRSWRGSSERRPERTPRSLRRSPPPRRRWRRRQSSPRTAHRSPKRPTAR